MPREMKLERCGDEPSPSAMREAIELIPDVIRVLHDDTEVIQTARVRLALRLDEMANELEYWHREALTEYEETMSLTGKLWAIGK